MLLQNRVGRTKSIALQKLKHMNFLRELYIVYFGRFTNHVSLYMSLSAEEKAIFNIEQDNWIKKMRNELEILKG